MYLNCMDEGVCLLGVGCRPGDLTMVLWYPLFPGVYARLSGFDELRQGFAT
jgi:hypothetical protein